jgi:hypothetical protein
MKNKSEFSWLSRLTWDLHQGSKGNLLTIYGVHLGLVFLCVMRFFVSVESLDQATWMYTVLAWIAGAFGFNFTIDRARDIFSPSAKLYAEAEIKAQGDAKTQGEGK